MMKSGMEKECPCGRHLVVNVDLRVAPEVRLAEVARALVPLKEAVGLCHLSFSLAYGEGGVTRYCNLPAHVSEDETGRTVRLDFPADVYVRLWDGTAERTVGGLSYRVDKRTEAVTEAAIDPSVAGSVAGRNRLVVNLADMDAEHGMNSPAILASLTEQAKNIRNWNLPIDLVLASGSIARYTLDLVEVKRAVRDNYVSISVVGQRPEALFSELEGDLIDLTIIMADDAGMEVYFQYRVEKDPNLIFLYEDNDGIISGADEAGLPYHKGWYWFTRELERGRHPAVYLCSPTSERYCPVSYKFDLAADKMTIAGGVMDISYYKEVDGRLELWIERRNFIGGPCPGNVYTGSNSAPDILKVSLGAITR